MPRASSHNECRGLGLDNPSGECYTTGALLLKCSRAAKTHLSFELGTVDLSFMDERQIPSISATGS